MLASVLIAALITLSASAEVYREVDIDGNVRFTDQPEDSAQAVPIGLPPVNSIQSIERASQPTEHQQDGEPRFAGYLSAIIITPHNNMVIPSEQRSLVVRLALRPQLRPDHRVQFWLDDKPLGPPVAQIEYEIQGLERGSHSIAAQVVDPKGRPLISITPVRVQVQRHFKRK
jgi:hypothetical protein